MRQSLRSAEALAQERSELIDGARAHWTSLYLYEYNVGMSTKLPGIHLPLPARATGAPAPPVRLLQAAHTPAEWPEAKRRRIWELAGSFHCSIIGTCLTTAELRQILLKTRLVGVEKQTDHELHGRAVLLAAKRDVASKLLQKALDRRHQSALAQFGKARTEAELRALWMAAVQNAEIPGAYWAVLTHAQVTEDLARQVFGEVHMLSHLVGAANRADIRRLRDLEAENATLHEKVGRQQRQLRDAVVARDATIASLNDMLGRAIASAQHGTQPAPQHAGDGERDAAAQLIADLRRRLASANAARERLESRVDALTIERDQERKLRRRAEVGEKELRSELEAAERTLEAAFPSGDRVEVDLPDLAGSIVLYVGGRAHQVPRLRELAERAGAHFAHHDGGIEDRSGLLEAHVARADAVFFPVDCVSHNAVAVVKRMSRQAAKPYVALRSSGLTSFAAALRAVARPRTEPSASEQSAATELAG
jgi:hypothetical protein